ncbi:MAG: hypothetical protein AAF108_03035 [Planctomycetota bacterium]
MSISTPVARTVSRTAYLAILTACALLAVGCQSTVLRGRVVRGPVNLVAIVPADDQRLDGTPIAAANVSVSSSVSDRPTVAVSDEDGAFKLSLDRRIRTNRPLAVGAVADGFLPADATTPFPPKTYRILIVLEPR